MGWFAFDETCLMGAEMEVHRHLVQILCIVGTQRSLTAYLGLVYVYAVVSPLFTAVKLLDITVHIIFVLTTCVKL